jgi:2-polyprenyl-6-methoxyphenol hydroxylase-like FAD-dependent oxidoreductase
MHLQTGHTCIGFEPNGSGVTARFENGQVAQGGFLIGADGIHSVVRAQLVGRSTSRYAGYTAWRGIAHTQHFDLPDGLALFVLV